MRDDARMDVVGVYVGSIEAVVLLPCDGDGVGGCAGLLLLLVRSTVDGGAMGDGGVCGSGPGVKRSGVAVRCVRVVHICGVGGVAGMVGAVVMLSSDLFDEGGGLVLDGLHGRGLGGGGSSGVVVGGGGSWIGHVEEFVCVGCCVKKKCDGL